MALIERTMALFLVMAALQVSFAAVYKVGDSAGWTTLNNIDYNKWTAGKTFHLGDIILFEYHSDRHNVMQVSHSDYNSCNASSPIITYTTGNDSITVNMTGHYYFLCGIPTHCQVGQKVDIEVTAVTSSMVPTPSPSPSLWLSMAVFAVFVSGFSF
ncbi:hypothetical protein HHK36_022802 [Tetracentron sinense]|uniref:Phytocyanin domain-containing protein n=1 Tax=Tetracentron sinense TaxID=13715 RepID=A0A834YSL9_TETSI|nr:hypothetical protein HHK36_022802 [Tetracentron sinense]